MAKRLSKKATKAPAKRRVPPQKAHPCSKTFEFFKDVTIGPGQNHDSTNPKNVDCYQWLHVWVLAKHPANLAMDNISIELVFELPGKMGAAGLANLEIALRRRRASHSAPGRERPRRLRRVRRSRADHRARRPCHRDQRRGGNVRLHALGLRHALAVRAVGEGM